MPRKIIVYIATSADGYIARPDGDFSWLDRKPVKGNYGMAKFYRKLDTVIMGRKTYEIGIKMGQAGYPDLHNYVFTRKPKPNPAPNIEFVTEDVTSFAKRLRRTRGKHIWLVGGGEVIGAFLDAGEVDEFSIHVIPVLIGEGIPLIQPRHRHVELTLVKARRYSDGVVRLHYKVSRSRHRQ
ncbi:MAG TPA: dihydrofolate reductase family protein [Bryobacteraceae bacterium]|jgi:dihydrofolate reductase